jgi:transposase, IS30 family
MVELNYNTNKRTFSHLTPYNRGIILALRQEGKTLEAIAQVIGCHKSTISRE